MHISRLTYMLISVITSPTVFTFNSAHFWLSIYCLLLCFLNVYFKYCYLLSVQNVPILIQRINIIYQIYHFFRNICVYGLCSIFNIVDSDQISLCGNNGIFECSIVIRSIAYISTRIYKTLVIVVDVNCWTLRVTFFPHEYTPTYQETHERNLNK